MLVVSLKPITPRSNRTNCCSHGFNPPFMLPWFTNLSAASLHGYFGIRFITIFMLICMRRWGNFAQNCINLILKNALYLIIFLKFRIWLILSLPLVILLLLKNMLTFFFFWSAKINIYILNKKYQRYYYKIKVHIIGSWKQTTQSDKEPKYGGNTYKLKPRV